MSLVPPPEFAVTTDAPGPAGSPVERVAEFFIDPDDSLLEELPAAVADEVPGNAAKQVSAMALQKAGDLIVDAKTVLPWLLGSVGAPAALTGLLVPLRESGSMLPQAGLAPMVRRRSVRKWFWVVGAGIQALAVTVMAVVAVAVDGALAGWSILAALAVFALARSLSSLASKDVLGRTIPKGARGRVTGTATVASGIVAIAVGVALRVFGGQDAGTSTLALLLGVAALAWLAAGAVYARVQEARGDRDESEARSRPLAAAWSLLREDAAFRRFVLARALLLVSALAPPFVVTLAADRGTAGLEGLGPFVISSGIAALVGGRLWGGMSDRSSRLTMSIAAAAASVVVLVYLAILQVEGAADLALLHPVAYLLLALSHTGVRIGRKTYVVDLAEGNQRTNYVAVSNSAMGVLLLVAGGLSSAIALLGPEAALLFLAILGLTGVIVSRSLPDVGAGR